MKTKIAACGLAVTLALTTVGCGSTSSTETRSTVQVKSVQASALDIGQRVSQWQLNNLDDLSYLAKRYHNSSSDPKKWIQAAFYIGLTRWTETVKDPQALKQITAMSKAENYALLTKRPMHADDHAIGQTYLWLAEQTGNVNAIKPTQQHFDTILANKPTVSLEMKEEPKRKGYEGYCQDRWCWSDALFMAPRTWLKLANITGEQKYWDYADKEFWATTDYLFSEKHRLFFRDSRYFTETSDNGKPVFWSRGNGWVFAGLPLIIDDLPNDHPSRSKYIDLYKRYADGLQRAQKSDGYWAPSLLDANKVKTPETSGTGFITFGLAWGVNNGLLTEDRYIAAVEKGWSALTKAIQPNGKVNWVQQVGKSPDPVSEHETQFYGVGAVLLAASEMTKWQG
ncbi:glycoside hydrolase family 88/105 protein [Paraglaciecola sp.]|uniref:glycoside hydrolase family 88/105 protein n=1 Tax=Paraglaciecola sp. TaxID=1920173 RepID=UPI003EF68CDD